MQVPLPLQGQGHLLLRFLHKLVVLLQGVAGAQLHDQLQSLLFALKHLHQIKSRKSYLLPVPRLPESRGELGGMRESQVLPLTYCALKK